MVDPMGRCRNRCPRVERLGSARTHGSGSVARNFGELDALLLKVSAESMRRSRTRLAQEEADAMRNARANGVSANAMAKQFDVHRGTA